MSAELAARLAPHVDRLALCVHQPAARNPEFLKAVSKLRPPRPTILVSHARLLAYRAITIVDAGLLSRFTPARLIERLLDAHVDAGVLHPRDDGSFEPSPPCRECAQLVVRIHGQIVDDMWGVDDGLASAADELCAAVSGDHPAFQQQFAAPDPPDASPSHRLLNRITALRYLRSDAHVAAMLAEGLEGPAATALTELWKTTDPRGADELGPHATPENVDVLVTRGLAERIDDRWTITADGRATRDAIEEDTNARMAAALGDSDRLSAFLTALEALPGTDPRS